jgi:wyosine [tRNA(Phe)-imidazoG37] synthetase (radical SAM superfamily)
MGFVFGPVPSRRLGSSLGVDLFSRKTCSLNCVYCQLGPTPEPTTTRLSTVDPSAVTAQVRDRLVDLDRPPDVVTLSGSGEPTLSLEMGAVIAGLKDLTHVPVVVLTNGTLFGDDAVRAELARADLVVPSLDAVSEEVFQKVNRPHASLSAAGLIRGLEKFAATHPGQWWLEVLLVAGINDFSDELDRLGAAIRDLRPEKVHLNTVVRPGAVKGLQGLTDEELTAAADRLGYPCDLAGRPVREKKVHRGSVDPAELLAMIKRRPVTAADAAQSLRIEHEVALQGFQALVAEGRAEAETLESETYYRFVNGQ